MLSIAALVFALATAKQPQISPGAVYLDYASAVDRRELAYAKKHLSAGKLKELSGLSDDEALSKLSVIEPRSDLRVTKEEIDGDEATVTVAAKVEENDAIATIGLRKEGGAWKIATEMWDLGGSEGDDAPKYEKPKNLTPAQKEAWRKLEDKGYPMPSADFLPMAALEGKLDEVKLFLEAGFDINSQSNAGTALAAAATYSHADVVQFLISKGADVDKVNDINVSALMQAAEKCDHPEIVKMLIDAGARTDIKSAGGTNAEQLAGYSNCSENAKLIREAKKKKKK